MMDNLPLGHAETAAPAPHPGPCGHLVQFYSKQRRLLDTLEQFIASGLTDRKSVV